MVSRESERRRNDRETVLVPATITYGSKAYTGRILNIASGGALIETSAQLPPHCHLTLQFGSVQTPAFAVWRAETNIGVRFLKPLTALQTGEQVARTNALRERYTSKT